MNTGPWLGKAQWEIDLERIIAEEAERFMKPMWTKVCEEGLPESAAPRDEPGPDSACFSNAEGTTWFFTVDGSKPIGLKATTEFAARREVLRHRAARLVEARTPRLTRGLRCVTEPLSQTPQALRPPPRTDPGAPHKPEGGDF